MAAAALGEHLMDETLATRNALVVKTMNEPTACRSACLSPRRSVATSGHAWTNLSLRPQALRHLCRVRDEAVTCRTDSNAARRGWPISDLWRAFPRETDFGVRLGTPRADLRIRRLGGTYPSGTGKVFGSLS
jgi:hypothetical protein